MPRWLTGSILETDTERIKSYFNQSTNQQSKQCMELLMDQRWWITFQKGTLVDQWNVNRPYYKITL